MRDEEGLEASGERKSRTAVRLLPLALAAQPQVAPSCSLCDLFLWR
jgi:hypothetical protein